MSKKSKKQNKDYKELPIEYLERENSTVSATECTGLIPRGIKTHDEAEAYKELYNVYQPDNEL
ncbi:MAG: hypothetical protein E7388_05665 [Ruminococcaceae bacterium]|nr:hypothetical protein [Oscillospiraceae bacterium]